MSQSVRVRRSSVSTNVSHPGPQRQASGSFFSSSPQTVSPRASNAAGEGHDDELADGVSASLQQPRARRPTISTDYASLAVGGENSSSLLTSPNSPAIMSPGGRTVNRGPARARSRTIQSIFETPTSPSSSGPSGGLFFQSPMMADPAPLAEYAPPDAGGDASPQMDSRPRSASNASATGRTPRAHRPAASAAAAVVQEEQQEKGRRRSTSVTSSAEVDIVLPSDRPGGTRGWMETLLTQQEDRAEKRSSRAVSQSAGAPDEILAEEHPAEQGDTHHADVVNHLDVIDPTVSVVSHLQNVSSAIMLPGWLMPRPTINLPEGRPLPSPVMEDVPGEEGTEAGAAANMQRRKSSSAALGEATMRPRRKSTLLGSIAPGSPGVPAVDDDGQDDDNITPSGRARGLTVSSRRRASIGRGKGSTYVEIQHDDPLDQHVVECLTKRQKARRMLKGLWLFIKTPFGMLVAFYGFNVVFWGAAIVFFLAKIVNLHDKYKQDLWVEISSQVVNALFTITGIGLAPQRFYDTYRIFTIWRLRRLTTKLRKERGLPELSQPDDLPDPELDPDFVPVLTPKQTETLRYQQKKFSESQTWYRPHATETHTAFPIHLALWNTLLMDLNTVFQAILCGCMWGLSVYSNCGVKCGPPPGRITLKMGSLKTRPPWTTGCLIPLGFLCAIGAGVIVWKGGQKTKKVEKVEEKLRGALGIVEEEDEVASDKGVSEKSTGRTRRSSSVRARLAGFGRHRDHTGQALMEEVEDGSRGDDDKATSAERSLLTEEKVRSMPGDESAITLGHPSA